MKLITASEFIIKNFDKSRIQAMKDIAELIVQENPLSFINWETKEVSQEQIKRVIDIDEHEFVLTFFTKNILSIDNDDLAVWAVNNKLKVISSSNKHISIQF